eukprot:79563_1
MQTVLCITAISLVLFIIDRIGAAESAESELCAFMSNWSSADCQFNRVNGAAIIPNKQWYNKNDTFLINYAYSIQFDNESVTHNGYSGYIGIKSYNVMTNSKSFHISGIPVRFNATLNVTETCNAIKTDLIELASKTAAHYWWYLISIFIISCLYFFCVMFILAVYKYRKKILKVVVAEKVLAEHMSTNKKQNNADSSVKHDVRNSNNELQKNTAKDIQPNHLDVMSYHRDIYSVDSNDITMIGMEILQQQKNVNANVDKPLGISMKEIATMSNENYECKPTDATPYSATFGTPHSADIIYDNV